jgi:hypothetical protein
MQQGDVTKPLQKIIHKLGNVKLILAYFEFWSGLVKNRSIYGGKITCPNDYFS